MDIGNSTVGWYDVEISPTRPPDAAGGGGGGSGTVPPPQRQLFPDERIVNMPAQAQAQFMLSPQQQQQLLLLQQQQHQQQQQQQLFPGQEEYAAAATATEAAAASSSPSLSSSHLQDYLYNLVERVEGRAKTQGSGGGRLQGPELEELKLQASRDEAAAAFGAVDASTLTTVAQWLYEHVLQATSVSIFNEAGRFFNNDNLAPSQAMAAFHQWIGSQGVAQVEVLRRGMEAASILLRLAACSSSQVNQQRAVHEDALHATVALFRLHLTQHIIPSWNQTVPVKKSSTTVAAALDAAASPKKRRRSTPNTPAPSSGGNTSASKEWKKVFKLVLETVPTFLVLMERLEVVLYSRKLTLDDQPLLMLTNAATSALEMDCPVASTWHSPTNTNALGVPAPWGPQIQVASLDLLTAAFQQYPSQRETLLEDFMGLLLKLPTGKRSLRAFTVRYTSARTPLDLKRRNTEWIGSLLSKTCPLDSQQDHRIQMMTALLLRLLQAAVVRPYYETVDIVTEQGEVKQQVNLRSGLVQCKHVADYLAAALLSKCCRKEASGAPSEYRPILSHLVDDLLVVLLIPEYPAAEIMLRALVSRLNSDLQKASESRGATLEVTYLNLAFDLLGKICAVEARLLALHRERPIEMKSSSSVLSNAPEVQVEDCFCGVKKEDGCSLIECDDCHLCCHMICVGTDYATMPDDWACDQCCLARIAKRERLRYGSNVEVPLLMDDLYAMRQSFLATLSHRNGVMGLEPAISYHLARWVDDLDFEHGKKAAATTRVVVHSLLDHWDQGFSSGSGETLTPEGSIRVILALLARTSPLLLSFKNQLAFLISLLSDNVNPSLRKLSVKAIERTMEGDHKLMLVPKITKAVSQRLTDDTISVREAAVSLVGSYVVQFPSVTKAYHKALLTCLSDVGVSVRKRAVKIFLEILTSNPHFKDRAEVFNILLERAADRKEEETVRGLIHEVLTKLWMENGEVILAETKSTPALASFSTTTPPASPLAVDDIGSPSVVTPTTTPHHRPVRRRSDVAAEQMMEVVRTGGTIANLETVLKTLLSSSSEALVGPRGTERKETRVVDKKQCDQLVNSLFELLLLIEERSSNRGKDIAAVLRTIVVFADVSPASLHRHLETVIPYLKADNKVSKADEMHIVAAACDILSRTSSIFERDDIERFSSGFTIASDLQRIIYIFQGAALDAAVQTLSFLAHHRYATENEGFAKRLLTIARAFFKLLKKLKDATDFSSTSVRSNIYRALSVLGLICQYHPRSPSEHGNTVSDGEDEEQEHAGLIDSKQLTWSNLNRACYRVFAIFFNKNESTIKCKSLQALGGIFMTEPRLMLELEQEGFIKEVLDPDADISLHLEAMKSWRSILIAEEKRVDEGHAKKKMEEDQHITLSKRISGDQDGDSNIFGGILTSYAEYIFQLTKVTSGQVRLATVELLEVLMRQGLVNPHEAVPHLFALQGDVDNPTIRSLACTLLMAEGEKRSRILQMRICAGVKEAFAFQRKLRVGEHASALLPPLHPNQKQRESIFDSVFRECIVKNKKQRLVILRNLLNLFDLSDLQMNETPSKRPKKKAKGGTPDREVALLGFTAEILAHLPYATVLDPLNIIHQIRSMIQLQGEQLIDLLATILRKVGLASDDVFDDRNAAEDALERAAKSKFPTKTPEAAALEKKEFDMSEFSRLCHAAVSMSLLLRLKQYLRSMYNLSETRCHEFKPDEKEKISDKNINKSEMKGPFDGRVGDMKDLDNLIRHYALFRQLMREESAMQPDNAESDLEDDGIGPSTPPPTDRKRSLSASELGADSQ